MSSSLIDYFPHTFLLDDSPSLKECDRQLMRSGVNPTEKAYWFCLKGQCLLEIGQQLRAISCCNDALNHDPKLIWAVAQRALAHEQLGYYEQALVDYNLALYSIYELKLDGSDNQQNMCVQEKGLPKQKQAIWLWYRKGTVLRACSRYEEAITSYNKALNLNPDAPDVLSGRGTVLALKGKRKEGLQDCQRAVQLAPNSVITLNSLGIVLMILGHHEQALSQFDKALVINPSFGKAWNNRAIALSHLGRDAETLESLNHAFSTATDNFESWYASAWALNGLTQMKMRQFSNAIESCEKAQSLDSTLYNAALCKLICLIASGRIFNRLRKSEARNQLRHDCFVVFNALKVRLLVVAVIIGLLIFSNSNIVATMRSFIPSILSFCIVGLIAVDLWLHKSKLHFVWTIYFKSGVFTYFRAIGILVATLNSFAIASKVAPQFMFWGWANTIFGNPGNIIFQPFQLFSDVQGAESTHTTLTIVENLFGMVHLLGSLLVRGLMTIPSGIVAHATFQPNLGTVLMVCFWFMLMLGIPFWARLEERIFRQGANSWRQICIRSVQFGLVHILVGIPILAGFVLIVPGFLFACRYKYVYNKCLKLHQNPLMAQEAGMLASTADHSVYNAILVTFVASSLVLTQAFR